MYIAIAIVAALGVGFGIGWAIRQAVAKQLVDSSERRAEELVRQAKIKSEQSVRDAEDKAKKMELDGKERAMRLLEDAKKENEEQRRDVRAAQQKVERLDTEYHQKLKDAEAKMEQLQKKHEAADEIKDKLEQAHVEELKRLESIAGLTQDEAKDVLLKEVETVSADALMSRVHKLDRQGEDEMESKAKNILGNIIQRIASSHAVETTTTSVHLPSDELKGRIIGKEGRNIKTVEQLTGCEIIVDDTPESITVSGFSPIRRQVAKLALENLIKDGRIHPGRIEEAVEEAKKSLAVDIKKAGEDALYELGIPLTAFDPKLIQVLGRLKYRTSYGQNVLRHSIEVAHIAGLLAQELKADITVCKRGGIMHDIGKAVDHDVQGSHPEIGYNIMKKFGLPEEIAYQSLGHHEDKPKTLEGIIVKAADAISGARPGARKDTYELYVQRLEELEKTASSFPGVDKVYAIQAGREVRVFVNPKELDDFAAYRLAKDIALKIESELQYPGEIRVTVIRETRVIEYAR